MLANYSAVPQWNPTGSIIPFILNGQSFILSVMCGFTHPKHRNINSISILSILISIVCV